MTASLTLLRMQSMTWGPACCGWAAFSCLGCLFLVGAFVVAVPWLGVPLLVAIVWAVVANYKRRVADQRVADQIEPEV